MVWVSKIGQAGRSFTFDCPVVFRVASNGNGGFVAAAWNGSDSVVVASNSLLGGNPTAETTGELPTT